MRQFTSHIDFSLTKKRLRMMAKSFSMMRTGSKGMLLLPLLLVFSVMFCTNNGDNFPHKVNSDTDELYANVELYVNPPKSQELKIKKRGMGIRYDSKGNPFTGTQEMRFVKNDSLFSKTEYENGLIVSSEGFDKEGRSMGKYVYNYIGEHFKAVKRYNKDGVFVEEWEDAKPDDLGFHKQWHPNGQLKYEVYFEGNIEYEGLMTLYDENGKIIQQERYKDGKLIETIK